MIKRVHLEEVKQEQKVSKAGKPYTTCAIKVDAKWRNGFGNKVTAGWQPGMTVEVDLFQEEYNGKMYDKFKTVTDTDKLEMRVKALEDKVFGKEEPKDEELPPDLDNLPF